MAKVHAFTAWFIAVIGITIAFLHPDGLLRKLFRALEVIRIELLRIHVIVGVGIADVLSLFLALEGQTVLMPLIKDVACTRGG
jgi:hypothetical protein